MRLSQGDINQYAEWSGDRNPLHVDAAFGQRTFFRQTVAHGMLTVTRALASAGPAGAPPRTLDIEFRGAIFPEIEYQVDVEGSGSTITVRKDGDVALKIERDAADPPVIDTSWFRDAASQDVTPQRFQPADRNVSDFARDVEVRGRHESGALPPGCEESASLTALQIRVLGLCSYLVGMELPGLRSLFTRLTVSFAGDLADSPRLFYRARRVRFDPQFRILDVGIDVARPDGTPVATGSVRSYVRFTPTVVSLADLSARLTPAARALEGKVALVCGGTRGLGGDITAALAAAGWHVHATYHRDAAAAAGLDAKLGANGSRASFIQSDVGDAESFAAVLRGVIERHGRLDALVLNACAPPPLLPVSRASAAHFDHYVSDNLRLAATPLTESLSALEESGGSVICVSSSFVDEQPPGFGHYIALKQAVESLVRSAVRESSSLSALIARPPRLQTAWNDTPTGVLGTIPADWAASHIVNAVAEHWRPKQVRLLGDFPPFEESEAKEEDADADLVLRLSASFTAEPLLKAFRFWFRELGIKGRVDFAPYGQILQTLLTSGGSDPRAARSSNVILLRVRDWLRELPAERVQAREDVSSHLREMVRDFIRAMKTHRAQASSETLLVLCPSDSPGGFAPPDPPSPSLAGTPAPRSAPAGRVFDAPADSPGGFAPPAPPSPSSHDDLCSSAETELRTELANLPGLQIVTVRDFHARYGVAETDVADPLREHIAHVPYQDGYLHTLATIVMRRLHRKLAPLRKVVVVDCDNTIWRGVVGEVGAEGVAFDDCHHELHATLIRLTASGLLIALCSKNEEPDVWRVFETRSDFALRRDHVVTAAINWLPKSENLKALATRLNVGLDSFIFIDDNPVECAEVRSGCPEVLTLQWPQDPAQAVRLLQHTWELDGGAATAEDQRRTQLYREEFTRQSRMVEALTFRDFIDGLDLQVNLAPLSPETLPRASQLTLRTNQFNFTTRRRNETELSALGTDGSHEVRTVAVKDRFGDYGLVGLLIADTRGESLEVDTFLLSCRVLGRGVEHQMAAEVGRLAQAHGAHQVRFRVEPTKRNTPARNFLESLVPEEFRSAAGGTIEAVVPAEFLAQLRFEPADQAPQPIVEDEPAKKKTAPAAGGPGLRSREEQIARASYELGSIEELRRAIDGRASSGSDSRMAPAGDVVAHVYDAFAAALKLPVAKIKDVDRLDALGCDSFRIVEITVNLTQQFPWLPSTLLFEHRSVAEIAAHVAALASEPARTVAPAAAAVTAPQTRPADRPDIAIVGMHLRCAGASSPSELWDLLSAGREAVRPVPLDRPEFLHRLRDTRPHWAGLIDDVDRFDAEFFGISPREAELMDPQLRLFLEVAWNALEDAGCAGAELDPDTGVFVGVMYGDYARRANLVSMENESPYKCWEGFSLANRLSQILSLRGPSLAVDTACSSSGTALHFACRALQARDCRVAVVGGVNLILDPDRFTQLGRLGILSSRGRCLAFGADADGTLLGEGAGVVVLRPLDEALRRGDRIYGIVKGTGVSTGNGTVGFTAPNPQAQAEAIRRALQSASIDPRTVSYVETHGTGTGLGDPIEVRGLTLAYGSPDLHDPTVTGTQRCTIGSVKPNVGHLEAGAGVISLIKVLLQLEHGQLLPSVTSDQPNPQIPFGQIPFSIQRTLDVWQRPVFDVNGRKKTMPRRAGLSSFGVGGANAHVIIEEAPDVPFERESPADPYGVLTVSARSEESLQRRLRDLEQSLREPGRELHDVCLAASLGRRHFEHRAALVARSTAQLTETLAQLANGGQPAGAFAGMVSRSRPAPKIAFLFTGQGAQYAGMGKALYAGQPVFRAALDECAGIFDQLLQQPLLQLLFAGANTPEAELLNQTGYTQPALFSFEYALATLWRSWGIEPDVVMGHSVGEIGAMCVAGGISLPDGLKLIAARGRLMQALPAGGGMTSVMASEARVLDAIAGYEDRVAIGAINGPQHIVISGDGEAVNEIAARLNAEGIKTKPLTVSHAFHSPLMRPMIAEYAQVVGGISFSKPQVPFVSCVTGQVAGDEIATPGYWIRNVTDPVRFKDGVAALQQEGVTACLEIGPQPVLLGMARQCAGDRADDTMWLPSLRKDDESSQTLLGSLAKLYVSGREIAWRSVHTGRRVALPAYPFARKRFWVSKAAQPEPALAMTEREDAGAWAPQHQLYEVVWEPLPHPDPRPIENAEHWIVFDHENDRLGRALSQMLADRGARCSTVVQGESFRVERPGTYRLNPALPTDFDRLFETIGRANDRLGGIVCLWPSADDDQGAAGTSSVPDRARATLEHVVNLAQSSGRRASEKPARVWLVTKNAAAVDASSGVALAQAPLWGLSRTIALEQPDSWGGIIDLEAGADDRESAGLILQQLFAGDHEDQIAFRHGQRYVARLVERGAPIGTSVSLDPSGTYLVTGGLGALGRHAAGWLVDRGARHIVLTSRAGLDSPNAQAAVGALEARGAAVTIVAADVARPADVRRVIDEIAAGTAPLRGIVHAAGIDAAVPFASLTAQGVEAVIAPKIAGAWLLHEHTRDRQLDLFVCFSSIAAVLGSASRAHYAAGNAFLDALAHERRRQNLPALSVSWGPWAGGGMATAESLDQFERIGNYGLDPEDALRGLDEALGTKAAAIAVADIEWERFIPVYEARRPRPMVAALLNGGPAAAPIDSGSAEYPWVELLAAVPAERQQGELLGLLRTEAALTLGFDNPADVPVDQSLFDLGMDSLMAAEFTQRLQKRLGVRRAGAVFDHPALQSLAAVLILDVRLKPEANQVRLKPDATSSPDATQRRARRERPDRGVRPAVMVAGSAPTQSQPAAAARMTADAAESSWIGALAAAPADERVSVLAKLVREEAASTLGFESPGQVPIDRTFTEMGMDSLMAAEFAGRLRKRLGVARSGLVFENPTVTALASALLEHVTVPEPAVALVGGGERVRLKPEATEVGLKPDATDAPGVVLFEPSLEADVVEFQRVAWPRRRVDWIAPRWRWMFLESAARLGVSPQVWLYRDRGRTVAHNGALPVTLKIGGEERVTAWLVDTMVLEEYRSQAAGSRLMVAAHDDLPFALSLGQTEQMRAIQLRLGWEQVAPLNTAQLLINPERVLRGKLPFPAARAASWGLRATNVVRDALRQRSRGVVREIERFGPAHDRLWDEMARDVGCAVRRDASYLNWKYVDQPGQAFLRLELVEDDHVRGVAVCMFREPDDVYAYRRAFLVDVVAPLANGRTLEDLLHAASQAVASRGADSLVCYHWNAHLARALRQQGFHMREPERHLLVRPGPLEGTARDQVLHADGWFVTQGDSDIDRPW